MKKLLVGIAIGFALYACFEKNPNLIGSPATQHSASDQQLASAYNNRQSDIQVRGSGEVINILPDDTNGSQHQKFILELASGQTLLVAHNIDLAPRINTLREGDAIEFYGEYEWNAQGGVLHWTHHDPGGRHENGWLKFEGDTYQ